MRRLTVDARQLTHHEVRTGLKGEALKKALADSAVKAVVITGAGKAFSGGADIKEFNTPKTFADYYRACEHVTRVFGLTRPSKCVIIHLGE